ncbi:type II toxin-antitoxin system RelE/ParE family toxin [Enterococcus sp. LJL90]
MGEIIFYTKSNGHSQIKDWLEDLYFHNPTQYKKVAVYLNILENLGLSAGMPYIKFLNREKLWELRPHRDRIIFFHDNKNKFILLHLFTKKTQKTPVRELEQALREKHDYLRRKGATS